MKNAIYPLFPCPLMVCAVKYEFSGAEKEYISGLEMIDNIGNRMSKNDKVLDGAELSGLRRFVDEQIFHFKKNLLRIKDENEIYITQSWVNQSSQDQYHPKHRHPNSVISGVIFLDDDKNEDLPPIRFHRSLEMFPLSFSFDELNEFNASCREFDPVQGMLMLFPSLVEHDVDANTSGRVRTTLSFNTFVRGVVGGREELTEVSIS
jgi:uncharacterized protein (TIGR02466 family)